MDTKNSQCTIHNCGRSDFDHVFDRRVVQRVILSILAVLALVFSIAMPISAEEEESDPWIVVPDITGKEWFKGVYRYAYGYETYPDMLYALEIGIGFEPDPNDVVGTMNTIRSDWNEVDVNEQYYLGSGYFAYYGERNGSGNNPQSGYNADLYLVVKSTIIRDANDQPIPNGDAVIEVELRAVKQVRDNNYDIGFYWSYLKYGADLMESRESQVRRYFTNTDTYDFQVGLYDQPVGFYFSFDLENTVQSGMTVEYLNQFLPLITLQRENAQIFFPNEYDIGYHVGFANGMQTSYDDGYNWGYQKGLYEGELHWQQDQNALTKFLVAVFTAPSYIINTVFDFDLFGFNVATIIRVLLTLIIVAVITKFALKSFGG